MKPAAIAAQLVDIKNDPQHKGSIRVTIHVPVEQGSQLTAAFGWPTMTTPVPVALARLNIEAPRELSPTTKPTTTGSGRLVQQAGIACKDARFWAFLNSRLDEYQKRIISSDEARGVVHRYCGIGSRKEIFPGTPAAERWDKLYGEYVAWLEAA